MSILAWLGVAAINMVVPLLLSFTATPSSGKIGIVVGVVFVFAAVYGISRLERKLALPVWIGAIFVAFSQFFPILHVFAGLIALSAARLVDELLVPQSQSNHSPLFAQSVGGTFIATLVMAGLLLIVSAGIGFAIKSITWRASIWQ